MWLWGELVVNQTERKKKRAKEKSASFPRGFRAGLSQPSSDRTQFCAGSGLHRVPRTAKSTLSALGRQQQYCNAASSCSSSCALSCVQRITGS